MKTGNQLPTLHYFHDTHCGYSNATYPNVIKAIEQYSDRIRFQTHHGELYDSLEGVPSDIFPVVDKLESSLYQRTCATVPEVYKTFIRNHNPLLSSQWAGRSVLSVKHQNPNLELQYAQHVSNCFFYHSLVPLNKKDNFEIFEKFMRENNEAQQTLNTETFVAYYNSNNSLDDFNNGIKIKRNMGIALYPTLCYTNNNGETVRVFDTYSDYVDLCHKLDDFIQRLRP